MANLSINSKFRMKSGYEIPILGYGVRFNAYSGRLSLIYILCRSIKRMLKWNFRKFLDLIRSTNRPASECEAVVKKAFDVGYRHVSMFFLSVKLCWITGQVMPRYGISHLLVLSATEKRAIHALNIMQIQLLQNFTPLPIPIHVPIFSTTNIKKVDSAAIYRNEEPAGLAIRKSGIPRADIFFTSKIKPYNLGYQNTKANIEKSLQESGLDYIDLMLVHAPYGGREARKGTWKALVEAQEEGKIRSLGISSMYLVEFQVLNL